MIRTKFFYPAIGGVKWAGLEKHSKIGQVLKKMLRKDQEKPPGGQSSLKNDILCVCHGPIGERIKMCVCVGGVIEMSIVMEAIAITKIVSPEYLSCSRKLHTLHTCIHNLIFY